MLLRRELSRRGFFRSVLGGLALAAGGTLGGNLGSEYHRDAFRGLFGSARSIRNMAAAGNAGVLDGILAGLSQDFFLGSEHVTTVPGTQHPEWGLRGHPADRLAEAFVGRAINVTKWLDQNQFVESGADVIPAQLDGDLVVLGSPVSNELSAIVLDYHGEHPYALTLDETPVFADLRWAFGIDHVGGQLVGWQSEETPKYTVPNFQILDRRRGTQRGSLIRNERGVDDYLVITRLKNFFDRSSFDGGRMITLVCGAHGLGTVGFGQLLKNGNTLKRINETVGRGEFQALLHVDKMRTVHDFANGNPADHLYDQYPDRVELADEFDGGIVQLTVPTEAYRRAHDKMLPRLQRYLENTTRWSRP